MKYIYTRDKFLKINEEAGPMTNDINWGDSFLGRFISSAWRRSVLQKKGSLDIPNILSKLKLEFDKIKAQGLNQTDIFNLKLFYIVNELSKYINDGNNIEGLINKTKESTEECNSLDFENSDFIVKKKKLIKSLNDFLKYLQNINTEDNVGSGDNTKSKIQKILSGINDINNYFINKKGLMKIYYEDNEGKVRDDEGNEYDIDNDVEKIIKDIKIKIDNVKLSIKNKKYVFSDSFKNRFKNRFKVKFKGFDKSDLIFKSPEGEDIRYNIYDFLKNENPEPIISENSDYSFLLESADVDQKSEPKKEDILTEFNNLVNPKNYFISDDKIGELISDDTTPEQITHQSIINLVRLFNRAYKLYTTDEIPSGRTSGAVSTKTKLEYDKIGDKYRNKFLFNKFEDGVLKIIGDPIYSSLFTEKMPISKKGTGKILLEFINSFLDTNKLYSSGAQASFLAKYFGLDMSDYKTQNINKNKDKDNYKDNVDDNDKKDNIKKESLFFEISNIQNFEPESLYYIIDSNGNKSFIYVDPIYVDNNKKIIKISKQFKSFESYFSNYSFRPDSKISTDDKISENNIDLGLVNNEVSASKEIVGKKINIGISKTKGSKNTSKININIENAYKLIDKDTKENAISSNGFNKDRIKSDLDINSDQGKDLVKELKR